MDGVSGPVVVDDDEPESLANERTMLGWTRTALALLAAGGAAVKVREPSLPLLEGTAVIALGTFVWLLGYLRYRRSRRAIIAGDLVVSPASVRLLALAVSVAAVGALAIGLASGD